MVGATVDTPDTLRLSSGSSSYRLVHPYVRVGKPGDLP